MRKQILYPKFIPRLFAAILDFLLLLLILNPIMSFIRHKVFVYRFKEFFTEYDINASNYQEFMTAVQSPEFAKLVTLGELLTCLAIVNIISIVLIGIYFVSFWYYFSLTPGKFIMRMRVVSENNFAKPSIFALIKRYLFYVTAIVGIWSILFSKKGQALHDKLSKTVVIKK